MLIDILEIFVIFWFFGVLVLVSCVENGDEVYSYLIWGGDLELSFLFIWKVGFTEINVLNEKIN